MCFGIWEIEITRNPAGARGCAQFVLLQGSEWEDLHLKDRAKSRRAVVAAGLLVPATLEADVSAIAPGPV